VSKKRHGKTKERESFPLNNPLYKEKEKMYTYSLHSYKEGEGYKGRGDFCGKLKTATLTIFGFHDSASPHLRDMPSI
jgi:hypothetical protein